jgi:hypothetical protein
MTANAVQDVPDLFLFPLLTDHSTLPFALLSDLRPPVSVCFCSSLLHSYEKKSRHRSHKNHKNSL